MIPVSGHITRLDRNGSGSILLDTGGIAFFDRGALHRDGWMTVGTEVDCVAFPPDAGDEEILRLKSVAVVVPAPPPTPAGARFPMRTSAAFAHSLEMLAERKR